MLNRDMLLPARRQFLQHAGLGFGSLALSVMLLAGATWMMHRSLHGARMKRGYVALRGIAELARIEQDGDLAQTVRQLEEAYDNELLQLESGEA